MRSLDIFILDEMIEQYSRLNPTPKYSENPSYEDSMEAEMLVSLLEELKALRMRTRLYEIRIVHLNQLNKNLMIEISNLKEKKKK